jgi:phosphoribosylglycinamide formyltransferase-1
LARLRLAVFISGRGSNLAALMAASADPSYPAEVAFVISDREEAPGLLHATRAGLPCAVLQRREPGLLSREADALLQRARVGLVCLAGFMRILEARFVEGWRDRMVNIHPSLLPAFPGLNAQRQALAAGVRFTGCTVHFVRPEVDSGPIIAQGVVPVCEGDDEALLSARILELEHRLYPLAVRLIADGRVRVAGTRVTVAGSLPPQIAVTNPLAEPFAAASP